MESQSTRDAPAFAGHGCGAPRTQVGAPPCDEGIQVRRPANHDGWWQVRPTFGYFCVLDDWEASPGSEAQRLRYCSRVSTSSVWTSRNVSAPASSASMK